MRRGASRCVELLRRGVEAGAQLQVQLYRNAYQESCYLCNLESAIWYWFFTNSLFIQTFYLRDGVGHDDHIWCVHISVVR